MIREDASTILATALQLSRLLLDVAERGDVGVVAELDAERLRLLHSFRYSSRNMMDAEQRRVLQAIDDLNNRAIGLLEHRRRRTERAMDTAAIGRRAIAAYCSP